MSPVEIPKLTPAAPAPQARDGQAAAASRSASLAEPTVPAADGIHVELGTATLAGEPTIDLARVQEIRQALREGSYPIMPARIADALIAARLILGYGE